MPTPPPPPLPPDPPPVPLVDRAPAAATGVFGLLLGVAAAIYAVRGRAQWFFQDEWRFLAARDGGSVHGLLDPHNEHWVTVPVVAYRILWNLVGARYYEPYQALSIGSHLVVAVLLHVLLRRRLGISPWIAVAATTIVLFTGTGAENVVWAFQITFTGSVGAGLAALLLADHPDPGPARRAAALGAALVSLMCAGVGLVMVGVVGLALLGRRGPRAAALATVPPALVYLAWYQVFATGSSEASTDVGLIARFVRAGLTHAVVEAGPARWAGPALVVVTLVGLALVVWNGRGSLGTLRRRLAIPGAMAVGAVTFFALTGSSRVVALGIDFATRSRYTYVALVLLVPVLALAADAVVHRWPAFTVPVLALLVAGIPANVRAIEIRANRRVAPSLVTAVAASPALAEAPADHRPFETELGFSAITAGWLREQVAEGRIPVSARVSADIEAEAEARLTLDVGELWPEPEAVRCREVAAGGEEVEITRDRPVAYVGKIRFQLLGPDGGRSRPQIVASLYPRTIATVGAPVTVLVVPLPAVWNASLCR